MTAEQSPYYVRAGAGLVWIMRGEDRIFVNRELTEEKAAEMVEAMNREWAEGLERKAASLPSLPDLLRQRTATIWDESLRVAMFTMADDIELHDELHAEKAEATE